MTPGVSTPPKKGLEKRLTRPRLALGFGIVGIALMGIDLMLTRSVFIHVGELMAASLGCLVLALVLDGGNTRPAAQAPGTEPPR